MSNENINVHAEDPKPGAETTAEQPAAEQPKPAEAATPTAEQPKPEGERPAKTADGEPAATTAAEEKGVWDSICDHFSENWQAYAAGGAGLAVGIAIGIAIAKKSGSTESAPAEA